MIFGSGVPYQAVWLSKEEAERFAETVLVPKDKPPRCMGVKYPQPLVLSLTIGKIESLLERIRPGAWLEVMDSTPE